MDRANGPSGPRVRSFRATSKGPRVRSFRATRTCFSFSVNMTLNLLSFFEIGLEDADKAVDHVVIDIEMKYQPRR